MSLYGVFSQFDVVVVGCLTCLPHKCLCISMIMLPINHVADTLIHVAASDHIHDRTGVFDNMSTSFEVATK